MSKTYSLELAINTPDKLHALQKLHKYSTDTTANLLENLETQNGLTIIKIHHTESDLTDQFYSSLQKDRDLIILSDELSEKRATEILKLCRPVETQLKRLLIHVLPKIENTLDKIIEKYQRHKSPTESISRIDYCQRIQDFSFGELINVLGIDVSTIARNQSARGDNLLKLLSKANNYSELKTYIRELFEPRTVWDGINSIIANPVNLDQILHHLTELRNLRNSAAHLKSILRQDMTNAKHHQKLILKHITTIKNEYTSSQQATHGRTATSTDFVLEAVKPYCADTYRPRLSAASI